MVVPLWVGPDGAAPRSVLRREGQEPKVRSAGPCLRVCKEAGNLSEFAQPLEVGNPDGVSRGGKPLPPSSELWPFHAVRSRARCCVPIGLALAVFSGGNQAQGASGDSLS